MGSFKGLNSPMGNKVENPMTNGERTKKLKAGYGARLAKTGIKGLTSPLK